MTANVARARDTDLSTICGELDLDQAPRLADGSVDWADLAARSYVQAQGLQRVLYNRQAMTAYAYSQAVSVVFNADGTIAALDKDAEVAFRDRLTDHLKRMSPGMHDEAVKKAWQRCRAYGRGLQRQPIGSFAEASRIVADMAGKARASSRKDAVQGAAAKVEGVQGSPVDRVKARVAISAQGEAHVALAAFVETLRMSQAQRAAWVALVERYDATSRVVVDLIG